MNTYKDIRIYLGESGELKLDDGITTTTVKLIHCFPWSAPARYLSFRDKKDHEVHFLKDMDELDDESRKSVNYALELSGFTLKIVKIYSIEKEYELRQWMVETEQGGRVFQTGLEDFPDETPTGEHVLRDLSGDIYKIPKMDELDAKSRKILWSFLS